MILSNLKNYLKKQFNLIFITGKKWNPIRFIYATVYFLLLHSQRKTVTKIKQLIYENMKIGKTLSSPMFDKSGIL